MKKNLLLLFPILFAAFITNAQIVTPDVTTYRGAFAPAPSRQWTDDWTNWNPQNTAYGTGLPVVNINTDINVSTTWTSGNVYLVNGIRFVNSGAVLTIEAGTIVKFTVASQSTLIVARGARIESEGTPCRPIVFTSNATPGSKVAGDWSGIILLGSARHNLGTANQIEGVAVGDPRSLHGGTNDGDNSGTLKYVRIEYAGFAFSLNNEVNGLTFGSVGNQTVVDYVQVTLANDDAFEWFGGAVNCKHLIAYKAIDDDWDTDNGFSGTVQYGLSIKDRNISDQSQSEGFESDNSGTGIHLPLISGQVPPKTSAKFYNITQIGGFPCASNTAGTGIAPSTLFLHRRGARVRRNSDLKIVNSILMNNWRGLFVDDALVGANPTASTSINFAEDSAVFRNNIIAGDFTTTWTGTFYNGTKSLAFETPTSRNIGLNAVYANDSVNTCSLLTDAWNPIAANADFRPNPAFGGAGVVNPATDATKLGNLTNLNVFVDINPSFSANQATAFQVVVFESGATTASNGTVTLSIASMSGWTIVAGGALAVDNANWNFAVDGSGNLVATSKPGVVIDKGGAASLGFIATRKVITSTGTNQNLSVTVSGGTDNTPLDNGSLTTLGAN